MKIGILTHFDSFQSSYALAVGWHERAKLLKHFDQDFDFLVSKRCKEGLYPNQKSILPFCKSAEPFEERVKLFTDWYFENLKDYDAILTADIMYQRKGNFLAFNQAIRNVSPLLKAKWYHWIHSSWVERPNKLPEYPENLRFEYHEESKMVYLNSYELSEVAKMYNTSQKNIYCVYNPKDPRTFFDFSPLVCQIIEELKFWDKDIIQVFPHCSTRMEAKGIKTIAMVFGALKRAGKKVAIVFANANSRSVQKEINYFKKWAEKQYNLIEWEDYLFTSNMTENFHPVPRKDIADLFRLANLFVFASWRETVGNVFQEAKISGNYLVLSNHLPCLQEMGGRNVNDVIYFPATHKTLGIADFMPNDLQVVNYGPDRDHEDRYMDHLANAIIIALSKRGTNQERWKFSREWIWHNQLKPLIYGEK